MSACPHYLEMRVVTEGGLPENFECDLPLGHPKKHRNYTGGQGIGPRSMGGKARKPVQVCIEWDR